MKEILLLKFKLKRWTVAKPALEAPHSRRLLVSISGEQHSSTSTLAPCGVDQWANVSQQDWTKAAAATAAEQQRFKHLGDSLSLSYTSSNNKGKFLLLLITGEILRLFMSTCGC